MIVNPPRSEVDLSPRLRAISVHALEKNEDPQDRPPRISPRIRRRLMIFGGILASAACLRGGLWYVTEYSTWRTASGSMADTYRQLARNAEAESRALRTMIKTGKPAYMPRVGAVLDPVVGNTMATQADMLARMYRDQANIQESLDLGIPIR